jgi:hypothetical protein
MAAGFNLPPVLFYQVTNKVQRRYCMSNKLYQYKHCRFN